MSAEDRQAVRALDQLHRRAPAGVHFDRVRNLLLRNKIDAVDAREPERFADGGGERARRLRDDVFARPDENVPAVAVSGYPERVVADQLSSDTKRHGASARRHEQDRARRAVDAFLHVTAARHARPATPDPHAMAAAGRERFHEPGVTTARSWIRSRGFEGHPGHRETAMPQRLHEYHRVAYPLNHVRCVSPERSSFRQKPDGVGVILEV